MLIGIDIIDIDRVKNVIKRTPRFLKRVYTPAELEYCMSKKNPYPSLAVRFAAKEAVRKLHPTLARCKWQEIEVKINPDGSPSLYLHGQARQVQMDAGLRTPSISLSHSAQQAIAAIITTKG